MEFKKPIKIEVGAVIAEIMDGQITLDEGKEKLKSMLDIESKEIDLAKDAPELEVVVKKIMGW